MPQIQENGHVLYETLEADRMKDVVIYNNNMIKTMKHGQLFCTSLQFAACYKRLVNMADEGVWR